MKNCFCLMQCRAQFYKFARMSTSELLLINDLNLLGWLPQGVLPEDLGGGVQHACGNPYPISDQNIVIFPTLFQTGPKI